MKKCRIIGGGNFSPDVFLKNIKANPGFLIAADSGYSYLKKLEIIPDLCVGDFDSLGFVPKDCPVIKLPVAKNDTDISAAIKEGFKKDYNDFEIYGALGGERISHSLANIQLLAMVDRMGGKAVIFDENKTICVLSAGKISFSENESGNISIFAFTNKISVKITGLRYSYNGIVKNDFPLGVSNAFIGQNSEIEVNDGTALIVIEK